jgi:hypothetical protein
MKIYCHSCILYTRKKWVYLLKNLCALRLLFLGMPLPEGVTCRSSEFKFFTVIPDGYEKGTKVKKV